MKTTAKFEAVARAIAAAEMLGEQLARALLAQAWELDDLAERIARDAADVAERLATFAETAAAEGAWLRASCPVGHQAAGDLATDMVRLETQRRSFLATWQVMVGESFAVSALRVGKEAA